MPRAYSMDLRDRLVACWREERLHHAALAARFRVSAGTVANWLRRVETTGSVAPKPHGGGRSPSIDAAGAAVLRALVAEQSDRTLEELGALYAARTGTTVRPSRSALSRRLLGLGLARKKSR